MTARVLVVGAVWCALAAAVSAAGLLAALRPPLPQAILATLTAALLLVFSKSTAFRSWVLGRPLPVLLLPHASRFVGFYFLLLHARGQLPFAFAVPGGWGDIIAATGALVLASLRPEEPWAKKAYLAWNVFGLADILFVIVTATRLAIANPNSMKALLSLPLSLLPTFFVPLIIASHVVIFIRLRQ